MNSNNRLCSFIQERNDLQDLNTRFAYLIDYRKNLNDENNNSIIQHDNALEEIKQLYENELNSNKQLIQTISQDNAKLKIDCSKYQAEVSELNEKCVQLEHQVIKLKQQLNDETILRVNCENKIIELKEEFEFQLEIAKKEMESIKSSYNHSFKRLQNDFDSKLIAELRDLRKNAEDDYLQVKDVWEKMNKNKLDEAQSIIKKLNDSNKRLKEEIADSKQTLNELEQELTNYKNKNASLNLELAEKNSEIKNLKQENEKMIEDNGEIQNLNVQLEQEITRFRNTLENEEKRLNIDEADNKNIRKRKNLS
jgi:chromosome segregation ATPase